MAVVSATPPASGLYCRDTGLIEDEPGLSVVWRCPPAGDVVYDRGVASVREEADKNNARPVADRACVAPLGPARLSTPTCLRSCARAEPGCGEWGQT